MPRGQKSKQRAREKRQQARDESQSLQDSPATEAEEGSPVPASLESDSTSLSPPASSSGQGPQKAPPTTHAAAGVSRRGSDAGAKGQGERKPSTSKAMAANVSGNTDPISKRAGLLLQLMLYKYKVKEPLTKAEMVKVVNKRYLNQFSEIFKMATDRLELIFCISLKKTKPTGHSYILFSQLESTDTGHVDDEMEIIKNGLLMPLLGLIFLNGNHASEEQIWSFLCNMGIQDEEGNLVFQEPRKLVTHDLVKQKYLEYRQVPQSDPPRFEFLWGPRAQAEISKEKILNFLARVMCTVPTEFLPHYQEALKQVEESTQVPASRAATKKKAAQKPGAQPVANLSPGKD
ncbi:melanoma-associated antigen B2-like [Sorex fumeus]|uniref:melanoma-associated antigen B2-like n=1 Tax=Sorex fumeus TaxID=62283 RepID=UPI0024ADF12D|nr:melanoma-associated antigen B2-like [Sorex fumeus]